MLISSSWGWQHVGMLYVWQLELLLFHFSISHCSIVNSICMGAYEKSFSL